MVQNKVKKPTLEERVDLYFADWGNDKKSFISIIRQLSFLLGVIATAIVAIWVLMTSTSYYFNNPVYTAITNNITIISIVFIISVLGLDLAYLITELLCMNKYKKNNIPSLIVVATCCILLIVFLSLICVEIYGKHNAERDHIYCIYMTICLSCVLFSTVYCFDISKKADKPNPNHKLLKSFGYTIGFLGIFAVVCYILWIMWYSTGNERLWWTCFILGRIVITIVGAIIVKLLGQIGLIIAVNKSKYKTKRLIYYSIFAAVLFALVMYAGSLFLYNGQWKTNLVATKATMTVMIFVVIGLSAVSIAFGSRYSVHLQKR